MSKSLVRVDIKPRLVSSKLSLLHNKGFIFILFSFHKENERL